ncbi:Acetolactate synthase large subunit [Enhygromyxa salina]|uniref:Acetolactate synthase large subunit n=1 Tax=Enhygromyxa salina TaxID=215803 RepID=A0A0C2CTD6_9BACT|nr:thiamine pyrophosphate-dependent enzyme [Enhygromyxa salina]KIG12875.1 Acetolactate synthase large subunit [Enhygromyxa salina]
MSRELQIDELSIPVPIGRVVPAGRSQLEARSLLHCRTNGADTLAMALFGLGVRRAFGVLGGAIAQFCAALHRAGIEVIHARHESGAAFMATEAHFATDEPVVVYTTTGPGATNALTGLVAGAWDGAKIIVVTGATELPERGRLAFQETGPRSLDLGSWLWDASNYLEYTIEDAGQIALVRQRLALNLAKPGGFLASLSFPLGVQGATARSVSPDVVTLSPPVGVCPALVEQVHERLCDGPFVIWVGFGAREAAPQLLELAERTGAPVMTSPRAKGVFPESHPQHLGVTGMFGGQPWVHDYFRANRPDHVLVLGSRLGQTTSCFDPTFAPRRAFIHVDIDATTFGVAYPESETLGVCAEIGALLTGLNELDASTFRDPELGGAASDAASLTKIPAAACELIDLDGPVHPSSLMAAIQRVIVERSSAIVLADAGNSFAWANARLRFDRPGRYRTPSGFASMTNATSGVVGAAMASHAAAVAIVGDGAMLMSNEVSTAVQYSADAKWIVLNDASYGMVRHGMLAVGMEPRGTAIPPTNFAMLATALGATGIRVSSARELDEALVKMMQTPGPVIVDVAMDLNPPPPFGRRNEILTHGWERHE